MSFSSTIGTSESTKPTREGDQAADDSAPQQADKTEIDLEALAEKIYRLLKEEARLERERLGRRHTW